MRCGSIFINQPLVMGISIIKTHHTEIYLYIAVFQLNAVNDVRCCVSLLNIARESQKSTTKQVDGQ